MTEKTTFKTLINEYFRHSKVLIKPSTYACFVLIAENHLVPYFGNRKIGSITETDIQQYIVYLYKSGRLDGSGGLSVKTIRDIILVLRLSLNYAYQNKIVPPLNWDAIRYPKEKETHSVNALSKKEELELIQALYMHLNRKTVGVMLTVMTGLRIGELCGLKMSDISLSEGAITVQRTVQRIYNKKKNKSQVIAGTPKTATSMRVIPIPSMLIRVLEKYVTECEDDYFLTGARKPMEPRTIRAFFVRFQKKHGLKIIRFHELRHTFAIRAIEIPEFDIKSLSELLGHKNVSFTLNVYGKANMQQKINCMNLLNDFL